MQLLAQRRRSNQELNIKVHAPPLSLLFVGVRPVAHESFSVPKQDRMHTKAFRAGCLAQLNKLVTFAVEHLETI